MEDLTKGKENTEGAMWPAIAAAAVQGGGIGLNAVGQYISLGEQRKNRRWQINQYLAEKAARDRAAQQQLQQQELQNTLQLGNYGQNQAQGAMEIFGNYNRTIGR